MASSQVPVPSPRVAAYLEANPPRTGAQAEAVLRQMPLRLRVAGVAPVAPTVSISDLSDGEVQEVLRAYRAIGWGTLRR